MLKLKNFGEVKSVVDGISRRRKLDIEIKKNLKFFYDLIFSLIKKSLNFFELLIFGLFFLVFFYSIFDILIEFSFLNFFLSRSYYLNPGSIFSWMKSFFFSKEIEEVEEIEENEIQVEEINEKIDEENDKDDEGKIITPVVKKIYRELKKIYSNADEDDEGKIITPVVKKIYQELKKSYSIIKSYFF